MLVGRFRRFWKCLNASGVVPALLESFRGFWERWGASVEASALVKMFRCLHAFLNV